MEIFVSLNLVVRYKIENIFLKISSFETKRDFCRINLGVREENKIFLSDSHASRRERELQNEISWSSEKK